MSQSSTTHPAHHPSEAVQHQQVAVEGQWLQAWLCHSTTLSKVLPHSGSHFLHLYSGCQCQLSQRFVLGFREITDVKSFTKGLVE